MATNPFEHEIMYHLRNLSKTLTRKLSMLFLPRKIWEGTACKVVHAQLQLFYCISYTNWSKRME